MRLNQTRYLQIKTINLFIYLGNSRPFSSLNSTASLWSSDMNLVIYFIRFAEFRQSRANNYNVSKRVPGYSLLELKWSNISSFQTCCSRHVLEMFRKWSSRVSNNCHLRKRQSLYWRQTQVVRVCCRWIKLSALHCRKSPELSQLESIPEIRLMNMQMKLQFRS